MTPGQLQGLIKEAVEIGHTEGSYRCLKLCETLLENNYHIRATTGYWNKRTLKYDDVCIECGVVVPAGTLAWWNSGAGVLHCTCREERVKNGQED